MTASFSRAFGFVVGLAVAGCLLVPGTGLAAGKRASRVHKKAVTGWVHRWNRIAVDTSGLDHTPVSAGETRTYGEQLGPGRSSRAMAMVHVALFESLNAIAPEYASLAGLRRIHGRASVKVAIAQAAHDTLVALFPSQSSRIDALLEEDLAQQPEGRAKKRGIALGRRAAIASLALGAADGSQYTEPRVGQGWTTNDLPGHWRQDPISRTPVALGAHWGDVRPFVLASGDQFRAPPPPPLDSPEYAAAYDEVRRLGGDGIVTPTERTGDQTFAGIYWAYDGTPSLCAPPRLYNQVAVTIADQMGADGMELARVLALLNVAMADAGIAIWESKYYYDFWRPVTGIREADPGTGPTGAGDGNPATAGDPTFSPLGAPASNTASPNFTPPFPAYPSGHAGFGGTVFQMLRRVYGTDDIPFTFVSDEYNGATTGRDGVMRPLLPRTFSTLSDAEEENGQSRIYLGIHWRFDKTAGIAQGRQVADYVYENAFTPRRARKR